MSSPEHLKALTQLKEEFKDISSNPIANIGVSVGLVNDNLFEWQATLIGPSDSSFKGGLFFLRIKFPDNYPQKAPEVCFKTPIYHVNVNPNYPKFEGAESLGHVCISTLNWWKPEYKMREVLTNIFALFYLGNPESPYGLDRAQEMRENPVLYEEKIKYFTKKYANPARSVKVPDNADWDFSFN